VQKNEPLATVSLVSGIVSFLVCPVIGGIVALITGIRAKKAIDTSGGTKTGRGAAQAGFILGLVNIVLSIIAIIGIVVLGVAASKHTQYNTLQAGDCYNRISSNSIFSGEVDKVNCSAAHDTEVTGSFEASATGGYPATAGFRTQAEPQCTTLGNDYLGNNSGTGLRVVWLAPNQATWDSGTHTVICGVQNSDGSRHTGSVKG
jgi:hypothetical protein